MLIVSAVLSATMNPIAATLSKYLIQRAVSSLLKYLYIRHNYYLGSEDLVLFINLDTGWKSVISFTLGPLYPRKNITPYCL